MIVVDTNILSETLKVAPEARVLAWLEAQPQASLFTTTVTRGEIFVGLRLLDDGQRRRALWARAEALFDTHFAQRVLSFDSEAADAYAEVAAHRRGLGKPISQFDAMIVGIARSRGASVATRNVNDFVDCGIEVVNPWALSPQ